jgi:hypothetical protein
MDADGDEPTAPAAHGPYACWIIALAGGASEFAAALLARAVPPCTREEVVAFVYLYVAGRTPARRAARAEKRRSPAPRATSVEEGRAAARFAAEVVALACSPLLQAIGWTTATTPPDRRWRCLVFGMSEWLATAAWRDDVAAGAIHVARTTPSLRSWEIVQRRKYAQVAAQVRRALGHCQRLGLKRKVLHPHDREAVLAELCLHGYAAGPRTTRPVLYFDLTGHFNLDTRAMLRRLARAACLGSAPPGMHPIPLRTLGQRLARPSEDALDDDELFDRLRRLRPETAPDLPVDDVAGARRGDDLRRGAERVAELAKTAREKDLLAAFALDDVEKIAEAARMIRVAPSTAWVMASRLRKRHPGKKAIRL